MNKIKGIFGGDNDSEEDYEITGPSGVIHEGSVKFDT